VSALTLSRIAGEGSLALAGESSDLGSAVFS